MFSVGEYLVYGQSGVVQLVDIREEQVFGERKKYYVLRPFDAHEDALTLVPMDNKNLTSRMRCVATRKEAEKMVKDALALPPTPWNEDARARGIQFRKIIDSAPPPQVLRLVMTIKEKLLSEREGGKKCYLADEVLMKKAEKSLYSELSLALGITYDQVEKYIEENIAEN